MNAKCPIVPVAMLNAYQAFDTNSISPVTVEVHFLKPIFYEEYQGMKSRDIAELVRRQIVETIENSLKTIDNHRKKCYVLTNYTTDGSGRNHREYKDWKADRLGTCVA